MKSFGKAALRGIFLLLPLLLTVELLRWVAVAVEGWLRPLWLLVLPESWYFPGLAVLSFILLAALIGATARLRFMEEIWQLPDRIMAYLPVIRNLYSTIKEIRDMFAGDKFANKPVVEISVPGVEGRLMGIVTAVPGEQGESGAMLQDGELLVYFPMSYQIGGYMMVIPESSAKILSIKPVDAIQLIMTAGLIQPAAGPRAGEPAKQG